MASAVFASRNEPNWSDHRSYVREFNNSNDINFATFSSNTSSSPNPSYFFSNNPKRNVNWKNHERQLSSDRRPAAAFTGSSINCVRANSYGRRYVTFRVGSFTRRELKELKKRLISDLHRVRILRRQISSPPLPTKSYRPPKPEALSPPEVALEGNKSGKGAVNQKRTTPFQSARDTKKRWGGVKNNSQRSKVVMRKCEQILTKLMKHKHGWVFNNPVDAAALGLFDYHNVINNPMDLGTIKSKLGKTEYTSPLAFASDVRLTFQNAMVYNGKGSDVFVMAELLLSLFEDLFDPIHRKFAGNEAKKQKHSVKVPAEVETPVSNMASASKHVVQNSTGFVGSTNAANLVKPMARDVKKHEMTHQEKMELAESLLDLQMGREGMDQIMAIVKKRVLGFAQEGDEVELDLNVLDSGTLWELDSFITRCRKEAAADSKGTVTNLSYPNTQYPASLQEEQHNKSDGGEEDIDIGEEIPVTNFPSVEIEKDSVNVSSSCSSSSSGGDSSSSDSDSGSTSDDDSNENKDTSDEGKAHTPLLKGGFM